MTTSIDPGVEVPLARKPRQYAQLSEDPYFPYQMGRLVGAAEMAAQLLAHQEKPDVQLIGSNLSNVVNWFFEPERVIPK